CMEHAYLETEGGVAVYDEKEGIITVWCGNQYTFRDQLQIARSLDWDPAKIRVIGSPAGGSFGSKDEISIQIHVALLALRTKKPVRMHWSRKESIVVSPKRHAFETTVRIGVRRDGTFTAIDLDLTADTGPYDTIAPAVLNLALECAPGPYRFPHGRFQGIAVYTNNAVGGEFRGFGNPQVTFPREILIDELAEELGIDPIELRLRNALEQGDIYGLGFVVEGSVGFRETLLAAREHPLWHDRERITRELDERFPEKRHGVGVASTAQAVGLGVGIPDYANVEIELEEGGGITLRTGASEIGQGNLTAYAQILAETLGCDIERITVIHGDTFLTPDSGSVTGSRSIHIVGNAIINAAGSLIRRLIGAASEELDIPEDGLEYKNGRIISRRDQSMVVTMEELAARAASGGRTIQVTGKAVMRAADADLGVGMAHVYYSFITQLVLVGVDSGTGEVEVIEVVSLPEIGRAINLAGVEGQCEGGVVMGQGYALLEEVIVEGGEFKNPGFSTYIIPTALDVPEQSTVIVDKPDDHSPYGAKGVGEIPTVTVAPAVANALYDAVGIRFRTLPITPEMVRREINQAG
ncbi:MAG TPA: xanthine dehydrogenase family protein molybdopterin-binding subunit, partial [Proteobacteria bacterium]|nr:xanthine dehydrogenase family protein molybdopterin-binding subunit [Pseudomonadota bacterium]